MPDLIIKQKNREMIRYLFKEKETLKDKVTQSWREKASRRTKLCQSKGKFDGGPNIWTELKDIFLIVQSNKCGYCERLLGGEENRAEYDVDHFRPKNSLKAWPNQKQATARDLFYDFDLGPASNVGYLLLAFNEYNYVVSCKGCNSNHKSNYFPVSGPRKLSCTDFNELKKEKPFLIFPLGDYDADPEDLITFIGLIPVPKVTNETAADHKRARVTIDFFSLTTRETLIRERARIISDIWLKKELLKSKIKVKYKKIIDRSILRDLRSNSPHANCARSFQRLYESEPKLAEGCAQWALRYLDSKTKRYDILKRHIKETETHVLVPPQ